MIKLLSPLRSTYRFISAAIDSGQIPNDMRRSLELVRTCHNDLQHLIDLRNENLVLLEEQQPRALERLNSIIGAAHRGLTEVFAIVEKCRPELHDGKTPLQNQMAWMFRDAQEFRSWEPVVSRHHAAVLAEVGFLRNLALVAVLRDEVKAESIGSDERDVFDNVDLLEELISEISVAPNLTPTPLASSKSSIKPAVSMQNLFANYCDLPEPVIPNAIPSQQPYASSQANISNTSLALSLNNQAGKKDGQQLVLSPIDDLGLSLLLDREKDSSPSLPFRFQPQSPRTSSSGHSMHRPSMSLFSFPSITSLRGSTSSLTVPSEGGTPTPNSPSRPPLPPRPSAPSPLRSQQSFFQPRSVPPAVDNKRENSFGSGQAPLLTTDVSSGVGLLSTIPSEWIFNYDEATKPEVIMPVSSTEPTIDHRHSFPLAKSSTGPPLPPFLSEKRQPPSHSATFDQPPKSSPKQRFIPWTQRYANITDNTSPKSQSYRPWRPFSKDRPPSRGSIYELPGSPAPPKPTTSHESAT